MFWYFSCFFPQIVNIDIVKKKKKKQFLEPFIREDYWS